MTKERTATITKQQTKKQKATETQETKIVKSWYGNARQKWLQELFDHKQKGLGLQDGVLTSKIASLCRNREGIISGNSILTYKKADVSGFCISSSFLHMCPGFLRKIK